MTPATKTKTPNAKATAKMLQERQDGLTEHRKKIEAHRKEAASLDAELRRATQPGGESVDIPAANARRRELAVELEDAQPVEASLEAQVEQVTTTLPPDGSTSPSERRLD